MSAVNDALFPLEGDLNRNADDPLGRRVALRKALQAAYDEGWQQGHRDGIRDYSEAQANAAEQRERGSDGA